MKKSRSMSDKEVDKMLNEILEEDEEKNSEDESNSCPADCAEEDSVCGKELCECRRIAEYSARFSLRVMEAMRSLQQDEDAPLPTSTVEDIVCYIEENYRDDGDLYAQVRTALKQVCSQGFVLQLLENEYHFVGPDAISMNQATCSNDRGDCMLASPAKTPPKRRKRDEDDSCGCGTSTAEETERENKRGRCLIENQPLRTPGDGAPRGTRQDRDDDLVTVLDLEDEEDIASGDVPQCSCSLTLTDEDTSLGRNGDGEGRDRLHFGTNSGEERRTVLTQDIPNTSERREAHNRKENDEKDSVTDETLLDAINDVHREVQDPSGRSKQREKELERWIKRCQEECERQRKRNGMNN